MTFCVAVKCREGLVALADTRIVRGSEQLSKSKLAVLAQHDSAFFTMSSGLRSVRDKAMLYFSEEFAEVAPDCHRLYKVADLLGKQLQRVRSEDGEALRLSNLAFNAHLIIGGQLRDDPEPVLYFIYPEGNWIEVHDESPYFIIGRSSYGKPVLDRLLSVDVPLRTAIALALLAFDATQTSVTDVDFPIDVLTVCGDDRNMQRQRYREQDVAELVDCWHEHLQNALGELPMQWSDDLLP